MTVLNKKQIVLFALVVMVGVAGYLNWKYEDDNSVISDDITASTEEKDKNFGEAIMVSTETDYFSNCRNDREIARSKALEILNSTINNPDASQETKDIAQKKVITISDNIIAEGNIENLVKAKGFEEIVVFIDDDSVTATIASQGLTTSEAAKIKDIIIEETGNNNIKIVEVN